MKSKWKYKLNLAHFYHNEDITVEDKGKIISKQLQGLWDANIELQDDWDLEEIIQAMDCITGYGDTTPTEEFDDWMEQLYNFADAWGVWITTRGGVR
tara:strand:+ start:348 stop:638 length:291 start_codon:yes stop_codon:yes gene_type:complete